MSRRPKAERPEVVLVKLGGSLLTDKEQPRTAHLEVIHRLAAELAAARREIPQRIVLGHGSGSFGHERAARYALAGGLRNAEQLPGIPATQAAAARLHRMVFRALEEAGANPFTIAPSSALLARSGRPSSFALEPLVAALELDLLPVVYGDVVLDAEQGVAIASTEAVLTAVAGRLLARGYPLRRALWLGETEGVYDRDGATLPVISPANLRRVRRLLDEARGIDVTGGMRHRVDTAMRLARSGITSWILDGRRPGLLERALKGEDMGGTKVES